MMLEERNTVVYGAGGQIGGAVARSFAREGARVWLAGRTAAPLEPLAGEIRDAGAVAEVAEVDALDAASVDRHLAEVDAAGGIDVVFNAISYGDVQRPLAEVEAPAFVAAVGRALTANLVIGQAASRRMIPRRSGVILTITGYGPPFPGMGNTGVLWAAVESLARQWACELGPHGIRVVWLRTGGSPESYLAEAAPADTEGGWTEGSELSGPELLQWAEGQTMLKRLPPLAEIGDVAAFLASPRAAPMTATAANVTCGAVAD